VTVGVLRQFGRRGTLGGGMARLARLALSCAGLACLFLRPADHALLAATGLPRQPTDRIYRGQSPADADPNVPGGGPRGGPPAVGQVPLGRIDPNSSPRYPRRAPALADQSGRGPAPAAVRPMQYSQPGRANGAPPYGAPAYGAPPPGPGPYGGPRPASPSPGPSGGYLSAPGRPFNPPAGGGGPGPFVQPGMAPGGLGPNPNAPGGFAPGPNPGAPGGFAPGGGPPGGPGGLPPGTPPPGGYGSDDELLPRQSPFLPPLEVPIEVGVSETTTGRLMFGVGVNSNAGLVGNFLIDEQNFDWRNWPRNWGDLRSGAFRGAGQQLRISAQPGTQYSQYGFTFRNPYLWDTQINFGVDAYYFNRYYQNWTEQRTGGRFTFGYQLTPDLSTAVAFRAEDVGIFNPTVPTPPELSAVLGHNALLSGSWSIFHDTRDSPFLATQGHRFSLELEQAFGTFSFPRAVIGYRKYFLLYERPDGTGRHVLNYLNDTGFTGSNTPIFDNFFAGGYNTLRGFYFRGASPLDMGVQVGGKFEFINSVEYMFPITADDTLRGVVFTDFGTVERTTEIKWEDFRVSPGFGLRVAIAAMGPAPIALDFGFPIHKAPGDHLQVFNFNMGVQR
jgi:outer membrane protein insertion porin family